MVDLFLGSSKKLRMSQLGYEYENFLINLYKRRNELLLKYLLMEEKCLASQISADYFYIDEDKDERRGSCEVRVYESALVVLPDKSQPIRIPLCYISGHDNRDYRITVETENGQRLQLSMMGEKTDYLDRSLRGAIEEMKIRCVKLLTEICPNIDSHSAERIALLMKDGRAAHRYEIELISKPLWSQLETTIGAYQLGEEYAYLSTLSERSDAWIGIKRGLMGDRTGEYLWFMIPIYSDDKTKPGNALAVEGTSEGGVGKATYLFKMFDDKDYASLKGSTLISEVDKFIESTNRCLIEVNFRREPIYLTEEKMAEPEYGKHRYAANNLKPLKNLRSRYIGRVMHVSLEQWKRDVETILNRNMERIDNH
jgi:hypothetical protein